MIDFDAREQREKDEAQRIKQLHAQFRADVQAVMGLPEGRRVVQAFIDTTGLDRTAYRTESHDMLVAATLQDAGRWWITAIREHCPERETQMRVEARKAERQVREDNNEGHEE